MCVKGASVLWLFLRRCEIRFLIRRALPEWTSPRYQQTIESFAICSLLQPIVRRAIFHVVRHGDLHTVRMLLSMAGAVLIVVSIVVPEKMGCFLSYGAVISVLLLPAGLSPRAPWTVGCSELVVGNLIKRASERCASVQFVSAPHLVSEVSTSCSSVVTSPWWRLCRISYKCPRNIYECNCLSQHVTSKRMVSSPQHRTCRFCKCVRDFAMFVR